MAEFREGLNTKGDLKISGSGSSGGGEFNNVRISGSGKVDGNVRCIDFSTSGSCKIQGNLEAETIKTSGSANIGGNVKANEIRTSGSIHVQGDATADEFKCSGSSNVDGNLQGKEISISGSIKVGNNVSGDKMKFSGSFEFGGNCEAEEFESAGHFNIKGLLNAEIMDINLGSHCRVQEIGGNKVNIYSRNTGLSLLSLFGIKFNSGKLSCNTIEADEIDIAFVEADLVRGNNILIREGSNIKRVEYSGSFNTEGNAKVEEAVKVD